MKKKILILTVLILLGFSLSFGNYIFFIGSFQFLLYAVLAGIIFSCFQPNEHLYRFLSISFIASILFSFVSVSGERFFMIFSGLFPISQYHAENFRVDLGLSIYLAIFFFISTIIGILVKKILIKYKDWFLTYRR